MEHIKIVNMSSFKPLRKTPRKVLSIELGKGVSVLIAHMYLIVESKYPTHLWGKLNCTSLCIQLKWRYKLLCS
jgi:hypothetical protein